MKRGLVPFALLLCALPASGDDSLLSQDLINTLTPIDAMPSSSSINQAFATPDVALASLQTIALDQSADLGIELRAIRALPSYCPAPGSCGPGTPVHDTLLSLINGYVAVTTTPHGASDLLRVRAAVEALGVIGTDGADDVSSLLTMLGDPSRDVRATVVAALRKICSPLAITPLKTLKASEPSNQVLLAIYAALQDLDQCPN